MVSIGSKNYCRKKNFIHIFQQITNTNNLLKISAQFWAQYIFNSQNYKTSNIYQTIYWLFEKYYTAISISYNFIITIIHEIPKQGFFYYLYLDWKYKWMISFISSDIAYLMIFFNDTNSFFSVVASIFFSQLNPTHIIYCLSMLGCLQKFFFFFIHILWPEIRWLLTKLENKLRYYKWNLKCKKKMFPKTIFSSCLCNCSIYNAHFLFLHFVLPPKPLFYGLFSWLTILLWSVFFEKSFLYCIGCL